MTQPHIPTTGVSEWDYTLTFDGGAEPNPGKGYGSYHIKTRSDRERLESRIQFGDPITNNQAEYMALLYGLKDVIRTIEKAGKSPDKYTVDIWGDSSLVVKQLRGEWQVKDAKMRPLFEETGLALRRFKRFKLNWHDRSNSVRILGH